MSAAGTIGRTYLHASDLPACYAGYLVRFRPSPHVDPRFISYWSQATPFLDQVNMGAVRSTIDNFSAGRYQNLVIDVPSLGEQMAIADYLDVETVCINELVAHVRQSNGLLRGRRVGLVTEAVTSGVPGSGFAGTRRGYDATGVALKHLCVRPAEYGLNISPDRYRTSGVRLLRTSDVGGESGSEDRDGRVFLDVEDVPPAMRLADGDILFSRSGTIGRGFIYREAGRGPSTFAGFLVRFRIQPDVDPRAIYYWSESRPFVDAVESGAIQSTISNFNADKYGNLKVPRPVVEQSRAIADYLDVETARIDGLMLARDNQIALLLERRQALITAAVTGQLKIPRVAA